MAIQPAAAAAPTKFSDDLAAFLPHLSLDERGQEVLAGAESAAAALAALEKAQLLDEAMRLAAQALPAREAVWWACMCSRHTAASGARPEAEAALRDLAEEWVRRQGDAQRRAAMAAAQASGFDSPEAWAAVGAFWSGDSMAPPEAPKVPPEPHFRGLAVAGSVALAAARGDARLREARLLRFLASARDISRGGAGRLDPEMG
ncbi:DUF6931 family protein [Roseomonas xinghualingensis]|uniref:DUF6931 family protein n=1 Tax=Roseomonas xinghualingensis TaxID=2986475 RepID=UPI0021F2084D|nr:hypothetical protein [Roseomonas sp. SXEYE001]MCV4209663.1 hypothetical protein [Roseomonas sp. SXEYE001]